MPSLNFQPDHSRTLDRAVNRIDVQIGSLLVTETDNPFLLGAGETKDFDETGGLTLYSPKGARVVITYWDEAAPTVRGDTGGSGGSLESRTVKELAAEAKFHNLTVKGKKGKKPVKADYIEALRG